MTKANNKIRKTAKEKGVYFWEVAAKMGVSEATITRALRMELSDEKKSKILHAIDSVALEKNGAAAE